MAPKYRPAGLMAENLRIPAQTGYVEPPWVEAVIHCWFTEVGVSRWYAKNDELDAQIRRRFLALHEELVRNEGSGLNAPRLILAAVIVLDQFSRNMFRGSSRAYAADVFARRLARSAVDQGLDRELPAEQRHFLYLPFEHSENSTDQALSLELISQLGRADWTDYAVEHKVLIDRFGRFPHRNQILNRPSTAEEIAHLAESRASF
jgi:uncharacterized protein (DUF924 family)